MQTARTRTQTALNVGEDTSGLSTSNHVNRALSTRATFANAPSNCTPRYEELRIFYTT